MMRVMTVAATLAVTFAPVAPVAAQGSHLLVVTGLGGEPSYSASFATSGSALVEAARSWSMPRDRITWLVEDSGTHGGLASGRSTRDGIAAAFQRLTTSSRRGDTVLVVLIGHGSGEGLTSRLSLPGPDPTVTDYAGWLDALAGRVVVVVVGASGSGDFLAPLSRPGRIVITATRSSTERNESLFGARWVQGLTSGEADANKDGRITVLESFTHAATAVERAYTSTNRLMTEHAVLDDDGDGKGSAKPGSDGSSDGVIARRVSFGGPGASTDPRVVALVARRSALEADVEALRRKKGDMREGAYLDALEALVVQIADISKSIAALAGEGQR